jgi:hypothetical protein
VFIGYKPAFDDLKPLYAVVGTVTDEHFCVGCHFISSNISFSVSRTA